MKRMKAEQKRKLAGVLAIVLVVAIVLSAVLPIFLASANAAESSDYAIEANVGFDGMVKFGSTAPISVNVTNNSKKNFSGKISILVPVAENGYNGDLSYVRYSNAVEIPKGGRGRADFSVPIKYIQRRLKVQLIEKDKVISEAESSVKVSADTDCWVGILSDDSSSLSYIRSAYYAGGRGETIDLAKIISQNKNYSDFSAFNVFVVNDYDFAAMPDNAFKGIMDRVNKGALMIIGGKSHIGSYDKLSVDKLHLTNYLPYSNGDDSTAYNSTNNGISDHVNNNFYVSDSCSIYSSGKGYIIQTDFSLTDISDTMVNGEISRLLSAVFLHTSNSNMDKSYSIENNLIGYTDRMPNLTDYTISIIKVVIFIYIAFIPILYAVLKKKDKRENALKIIPAAAVMVSLLIYLVSINTVYKKPIGSVINYIDFGMSGTDATEKTYMNIKSPSKGKLEIIPEDGKTLMEISDVNYNMEYAYNMYSGQSNSAGEEDNINAEIISKDGKTIICEKNKPMWDNTYLTLQSVRAGEGSFEGDLSVDENGIIQGKIVNNTGVDFSNSAVIVNRGIETIALNNTGEIKNGEAFDISSLNIRTSNPVLDTYSYSDVFNKNDILTDRRTNLKDVYKLEIQQDILDGVVSDAEQSGYENLIDIKVTVLGFSNEPLYGGETTVNGKKISANETNVFTGCFMAEYADYQQYHKEPVLNDSQWGVVNRENATLSTAENIIILNDRSEGVTLQCKCGTESWFKVNWQCNGNVSVYNNKSGVWEHMDTYGTMYFSGDGYSDEYGMLHIKAENLSHDIIDIPQIVIVGDTTEQNIMQ